MAIVMRFGCAVGGAGLLAALPGLDGAQPYAIARSRMTTKELPLIENLRTGDMP
jgi:hypothetical protein